MTLDCIPKRNGLAQRSPKRLAKEAAWEEIRRRVLDERPYCEAQAVLNAAFFLTELDAADHSLMVRIGRRCTGRSVDVHHVKQRSAGGGDEDSNLRALCRTCHMAVHDHIELAHKLGLLRRSYDSPPIPSQVADKGGESGTKAAPLAVVSAPTNDGTATPDSPTCFCSQCGKEGADRVGLTVQRDEGGVDEGGAEEWGFCSAACLVIFVRDRWMVSQ